MAIKIAVFVECELMLLISFVLFRSSLVTKQFGCLARHLLKQWLLQTKVCSILHHFGRPIEDALGWFSVFCCHEQHYQLILKFQQTSIPTQQPSKLELLSQFGLRNDLFARNGELFQLEIVIQLLMNGSWP